MGVVYRAWDDALDRIVALKLLQPEVTMQRNAKTRFLREARLAARINHPAVAHIYEIGEHDDAPLIAMEFVPGRTLREEMNGPQPPQRVVFLEADPHLAALRASTGGQRLLRELQRRRDYFEREFRISI